MGIELSNVKVLVFDHRLCLLPSFTLLINVFKWNGTMPSEDDVQ